MAGRHGVAVAVLGEEVDDHDVGDDDLVAVAVEGVAGSTVSSPSAVPGRTARPLTIPAMQHAVVPAELVAEVELLLGEVGLVEQLSGEVAGALDRHGGSMVRP